MLSFTARTNIERFRRLVPAELEGAKGSVLARMLFEGQERLQGWRAPGAPVALQDRGNDGSGCRQGADHRRPGQAGSSLVDGSAGRD